MAKLYASAAAIEEFFTVAASSSGDLPAWSFGGCEAVPDAGVSSGGNMFCRFATPGEPHGLHVILGMAKDRRVEDVGTLG